MTNGIDPESWPRLALTPDALESAAKKIIESGALGRSKIYGNLLRYLVNCANTNSNPKEIEIAIDVLGRDEKFDVAKDSAVRVYIHQLRKKLELYYKKYEPDAPFHLTVPKGQYTIEALERPKETPPAGEDTGADQTSVTALPQGSRPWLRVGMAAIALLLVANLAFLVFQDDGNGQPAAKHAIWQAMLDDSVPLLVVMGDYYIFGELDEAGNVKRMIRDFNINSEQDLENLFAEQPKLGWQYYDLDLSYLPESSAVALNNLLPVLHSGGKAVSVKMVSELTVRDLQTHHVVYVGYVSALKRIHDLVFSVSDLKVGENYDQLINSQNNQTYTSSAGLPTFDQRFLDYGWFISLPSTRSTQLIVVTGMRDAGLIHTSLALTDPSYLAALDKALAESDRPRSAAYEALYSVRGLNRMSFDAELEYASYLNAADLWRDGLSLEP